MKPTDHPGKWQLSGSSKEQCYHALFLVASCLLVYASSLSHDFIPLQDDNAYIIYNSSIRGFSLVNLQAAFTSFYAGNYAPVQMVSYMLDYSISGEKPAGFILTNIILHSCNGLMFYGLLVRSRFTPVCAAAAAGIFLLHPVQVESVVWVSERKNVLAMMFFLFAIHCYLNYLTQVRNGRTTQYLLSLVSFILALLSKSVVVILPLVLLVYDLAYRERDRHRQWLKDKIPYIFIALIGVSLTIYSQDPGRDGGRAAFHGGSALATFFTMLPVLMKYLRNIFCPTDLSIYYGSLKAKASLDEEVFLTGLFAVALLACGVVLWRKNRELCCWYALFFVGLLPVSQIVPIVTLINDRYLYFPMLGGAAFISGCASLLLTRIPRSRTVVTLLAGGLFVTLSVLTYRQTKTWQNTQTLYRQVIRTNPEQIDLKFLEDGYFLVSELNGLANAAKTLLNNFPASPEVLKFAAKVYNRYDDPLQGRPYLEQAVQANQRDIDLLFLLAENYQKTGNSREAGKVYTKILELNPESQRAKEGLTESRAGVSGP